jgi:hypothetical protein
MGPDIMMTYNPTAKRVLKVMPCTHLKQTRRNTPSVIQRGGVKIDNGTNMFAHHILPLTQCTQLSTGTPRRVTPPAPLQPQSSPWLARGQVAFQVVPLIYKEAINYLTDKVWIHSPDVFTPQSPTKRAHISQRNQLPTLHQPNYSPHNWQNDFKLQKLMHDLATAEIWQTAFSKDFAVLFRANQLNICHATQQNQLDSDG